MSHQSEAILENNLNPNLKKRFFAAAICIE
jgi:hypothetical protein